MSGSRCPARAYKALQHSKDPQFVATHVAPARCSVSDPHAMRPGAAQEGGRHTGGLPGTSEPGSHVHSAVNYSRTTTCCMATRPTLMGWLSVTPTDWFNTMRYPVRIGMTTRAHLGAPIAVGTRTTDQLTLTGHGVISQPS